MDLIGIFKYRRYKSLPLSRTADLNHLDPLVKILCNAQLIRIEKNTKAGIRKSAVYPDHQGGRFMSIIIRIEIPSVVERKVKIDEVMDVAGM